MGRATGRFVMEQREPSVRVRLWDEQKVYPPPPYDRVGPEGQSERLKRRR